MFQRLPSDDIAQHVETPASQACQMHVCRAIIEVQRPSHKTLPSILSSFPESVKYLRRTSYGSFIGAGEVHTSKEKGTTSVVNEA